VQPQWALTNDVGEDHFEQRPVSENSLQLEARPAHVEALLFGSYCHLQHEHDVSTCPVTCSTNVTCASLLSHSSNII
jgi:hypothetical protein